MAKVLPMKKRESSMMTLRESKGKVQSQEERIYQFLQSHRGDLFTPEEIHVLVFEAKCPLTSVRRAITNLTNDGRLEKLIIRRRGNYGKKVHTWRLNERR